MKNHKILFGLAFLASVIFTNCSNDDNSTLDDGALETACDNYNKDLLTLSTAFDNSPNAVISYNSFLINSLNSSTPSPKGNLTTNTDLTYQLPTSSSFYNYSENLHGIFVTRAGKYFTFNASSGIGQEYSVPTNITAPVEMGTSSYVIEVLNSGYANHGVDDHFRIKSFNIDDGATTATLPISLGNTTFNNNSFFNVESMSSATNHSDELYFLSGTNLITINTASNTTSHIDLYPSFSTSDYVRFLGLEYSESHGLIAIMDSPDNNIEKLVKIDASNGTYSDLLTIPSNINTEFYSTTYSECKDTYYLTTLINGSNPIQTKYFEFDLALNAVNNTQYFADYVFGIELIP